jgi:hypothetical protein
MGPSIAKVTKIELEVVAGESATLVANRCYETLIKRMGFRGRL